MSSGNGSSEDNENDEGSNSDHITSPRPEDVLCGRGRAIRNHPGNQRFLELIMHYKALYMSSRKGGKLEIVKTVMEEIKSNNGRFLQQVKTGNKSSVPLKDSSKNNNGGSDPDNTAIVMGGCWVDIGTTRAMTKTSQAFRDLRPTGTTTAMSGSRNIAPMKDSATDQPPPRVSSPEKLNHTVGSTSSAASSSASSSGSSSSGIGEDDSDDPSSGSSEEGNDGENNGDDDSSSSGEEEEEDELIPKNGNHSKSVISSRDNPQCGDDGEASRKQQQQQSNKKRPSLQSVARQRLASLQQQRLSYNRMTAKKPKALLRKQKTNKIIASSAPAMVKKQKPMAPDSNENDSRQDVKTLRPKLIASKNSHKQKLEVGELSDTETEDSFPMY